MKKLILTPVIVILFGAVYGQVCTPMWTDPGSGIIPDTTTNLPQAYLGSPYDVVVQFKVPAKAPYAGDSISVDHVVLDSVAGLIQIPASAPFHITCNPSNCSFLHDSVGCVRIQGTPTVVGTYDLVISTRVFITPNAGIPFPTPGYRIVVNYPIGIAPLSQTQFDVSQNSPNPFSGETDIYVNLPHAGNLNVKVSNLVGNEMLRQTAVGKKGVNTISIDGNRLAPGIYFFTVEDGEHSATRRMVVDR